MLIIKAHSLKVKYYVIKAHSLKVKYSVTRWGSSGNTDWSFAEKTFVKQSMMLEWEKCAQKLRFRRGINHTRRFEGKLDLVI